MITNQNVNWIALYVNCNSEICFVFECIPREILKIIGKKNMVTVFYRTEACDAIMCGYFWSVVHF